MQIPVLIPEYSDITLSQTFNLVLGTIKDHNHPNYYQGAAFINVLEGFVDNNAGFVGDIHYHTAMTA